MSRYVSEAVMTELAMQVARWIATFAPPVDPRAFEDSLAQSEASAEQLQPRSGTPDIVIHGLPVGPAPVIDDI